LNTRVVVIARADPKQVLEAGPGVKIPMTDVLIALDGFSDVFDQLEVMFKDNPMFTLGEKNGMKTITIDAPVPDSFAAYKPQIIADPKSKRLYLVSRASFADETIFGQGPRLSSSDDFKAATDGLPTEGNALNYFSKKGAAAFVEFYDKQIMAQAQMPDNLRERLIAFGGLDKIPHGLAGTRVNLPEGIMFQFTSTHSAKEVVAMAPIAGVGLVAAMAIPAFSKVRQQSREKAVLNNLRQPSSAAQQYMLEKGVRSASYHDLVGTSTDNYLRNVAPVADEDYTGFHMNQSDTQITVSGSFGTVTFNQ
jgi:type IV pilus assembly protein PilA